MDKRAWNLQCYSRVCFRGQDKDIVLGVKHHKRYRITCDEAHPNRSAGSTSWSKCLFFAPSSSSLRHESWLGHTIRGAAVVEGAPFFGSCSVHTAYRHRREFYSSRVHTLVLHKVVTARKCLATFTYESYKKTK